VSRGTAVEDASRGRRTDRVSFRADHRESGSVQCGKQITSYLGLERSRAGISDGRGISRNKGNSLLRFLLVEAAQVTVRSLPEWRSKYCPLTMRRGRKIAKVAMARKLAVVCIGCCARNGITSN
jgi:hypothetical protein